VALADGLRLEAEAVRLLKGRHEAIGDADGRPHTVAQRIAEQVGFQNTGRNSFQKTFRRSISFAVLASSVWLAMGSTMRQPLRLPISTLLWGVILL